jgi:hypothetical protein
MYVYLWQLHAGPGLKRIINLKYTAKADLSSNCVLDQGGPCFTQYTAYLQAGEARGQTEA